MSGGRRIGKMDAFLSKLLEAFGVGAFIPAVMLRFCWHADDQLQPELTRRFAAFLLANPRSSPNRGLATFLVHLLDHLLGQHPLRARFILRSFVASYVAVATTFVVWLVLNRHDDNNFLFPSLAHRTLLENAVEVLFLGSIVNLIPDYVSLVQTRMILRKMADKRLATILLYLLLDLVLTTVIVLVAFEIAILLLDREGYVGSGGSVSLFLGGLPFDSGSWLWPGGFFGIFIYSTYVTSVWVWLYASAILLVRTRGIMRPFRNILRVRERPVRSVGIVAFGPAILASLLVATFV